MARALTDPGAVPPLDPARFAVYRNNVAETLLRTLRATYPAIEALVGEANFRTLAAAFTARHPMRSPVLAEYGAEMAAFLAAFAPVAGHPYLPDVARIEWARLRAWHGADAQPVPLEVLGGLAPEALDGLRLHLHPTLACIRSDHAALSIWQAVTGRGPGPDDPARAETALVLRPDLEVLTLAPGPAAAALLAGLGAGLPLGAAAAGLSGADLPGALGEMFALGAITGVSLPGSDLDPRGDPG